MGTFSKTFGACLAQQGALENLDNVLFYTDPEDGLNYDLTFTDVDTLEYYLQLIEE